jgi:hypothetical protein
MKLRLSSAPRRLLSFAAGALCAAATVAQSPVVFSDGDFTGWTQHASVVNLFPPIVPASGTSATLSFPNAGNPGASVQMSHTVTSNAGIYDVFLSPTAIWNPAVDGPAGTITMTIDAATQFTPYCCAAQGVGIACEQGGVYFIGGGTVAGMSSAWHPLTPVLAVASQFQPATALGPNGVTPDFANGGPIRFGFYASNGTCQNCPGFSTTVRYDNWSLSVATQAVYPGTSDGLRLRTSVSASPVDLLAIKSAPAGAPLTLTIDSPTGAWTGLPLVLAVDLTTTGTTPFPGPPVWLDFASLVVVVDGLLPTPLGPAQTVSPLGNSYGLTIPPGLTGLSAFWQAAAFAPAAIGITDAYEIRFL